MDLVEISFIVVILFFLFVIWWRTTRRRQCRKCRYYAEHYITSIHGQGLFRFGYCQKLIYDTPMVEPDADRDCPDFEKVSGKKREPGDIDRGSEARRGDKIKGKNIFGLRPAGPVAGPEPLPAPGSWPG